MFKCSIKKLISEPEHLDVRFPGCSGRSGVLLGVAVNSQDLGRNRIHDRSGMNEGRVVAL